MESSDNFCLFLAGFGKDLAKLNESDFEQELILPARFHGMKLFLQIQTDKCCSDVQRLPHCKIRSLMPYLCLVLTSYY